MRYTCLNFFLTILPYEEKNDWGKARKLLGLIAFRFAKELLLTRVADFWWPRLWKRVPDGKGKRHPYPAKTAFIVVHNAAESVPPRNPLCRCPRFEKSALSSNATPSSPCIAKFFACQSKRDMGEFLFYVRCELRNENIGLRYFLTYANCPMHMWEKWERGHFSYARFTSWHASPYSSNSLCLFREKNQYIF